MNMYIVIVVALTLLLVYFGNNLLTFITFIRKARKIPTKDCVPIFGHSFKYIGPLSGLMKTFLEVVKQNESVFALWAGPLPFVSITKPEHVEVILGNSKYIHKDFPYKFLNSWLGSGLVITSGTMWQTHRKLITPAFHFSILDTFLQVFTERSDILVKNLTKYISCEKFDIYPHIKMCTLGVILETAMGIQIDTQDNKEHAEYADACCNITEEIMKRVISPWLFPQFIYSLTPGGRRFEKYLQTLHNFTDKVLRERKQAFVLGGTTQLLNENDIGTKKKLSFLDLLLQSDGTLTDEEVRDEVQTFMFAGHDTTTAGICWCLQMLASHPQVQDRVCEELEKTFGDSDHHPTTRDLKELKYLERVIKETLRLYPSVPMIGREMKEDVRIGEHVIPSGITVGIPIFAVHRDPELYRDPHQFNPDNFLPERVAARHPYAYIPFSAGPRNCIGQKFAMLEMKIMLSCILRNFKLEATGEIPTPLLEIICRPQNGVQIKIVPRNSSMLMFKNKE
ncbi:hypothetical protein L9F63_023649 [Diploptera punctata]|uniref:Cytochrome P450 n=1 Tax=Diploptera punctata TaxID=6984 RepID=A0AAD8E8U6_DIPPU|nr:hypothetical protein L9F63_023649 [Diploptera punctata]